jgi:predicted ATPase
VSGDSETQDYEARVRASFAKQGFMAWRGSDPVGGRSEMRRGLASLREEKVVIFDGLLRCTSARAEAESGDFSAALTCLEQAFLVADRTGAHWYDAEILRTRGEILVKQDPTNSGAAEESFLTAIATAQHQLARSFELRAALALARLYQSIGHPADADAVLRPALKGFVPTPQFPEIAEALGLVGDVQTDPQLPRKLRPGMSA